jgi:class 3 adenylate cyclase
MAKRSAHRASEKSRDDPVGLLHAGLDALSFGFAVLDKDLKLVTSNKAFRTLRGYPAALCKPGTEVIELYRFNAERGDYGAGNVEEQAKSRLDRVRKRRQHELEYELASGRILNIQYTPISHAGLLLSYADITERKRAQQELAKKEAQLRVAMDNMPGALAYTDEELNIVVCNDRFAEIYQAPLELFQPGRPYPELFRYLAEHGYYADGDVEALVAERAESLRNPSDKTLEDHTPDGRIHEVHRRRVAAGGTVTVITDITERKQAEAALLEAKRRTEEANKLVTEKNETLEALSSKLAKYLSPQIYNSIFSGAQTVEISSKRKKLTIFFSDIAAFTETTDNLESEELTDVLNHYLTEMSTIALEYGATIDKYIGDAIMLFFGDPETKGVKEDAKACVMMAIAMQRRMRELEYEWRTRGLERPFRIRMGICTGFCTVGNFGSQDRMDYTIIGNEVNLAARLESAAEAGSILLAHETNSLVQDIVLTEEQPPMTVKGFVRPINNYKVVGTYDELIDEGRIVLQERDGIRLLVDLTKQDKSEAIAVLEEVLSQLKD